MGTFGSFDGLLESLRLLPMLILVYSVLDRTSPSCPSIVPGASMAIAFFCMAFCKRILVQDWRVSGSEMRGIFSVGMGRRPMMLVMVTLVVIVV